MRGVDVAEQPDLDPPPLRVGETFERYEIVRLIGRGGSAWVYEAYQAFMDRRVAIKVIPCEPGQAQEYKRRAKAEAVVLSRLRHPNVVAVFDAGVTDDGKLIYIVMELLEGRTLRETLGALKALTVPEVLILGAQVCDAVEAAHRLGAIHRDLKPDNIFIEEGNHVRVLDFGVAKFLGAGFVTAKFRWHGTPLYMSPEHIQGLGVTERSDVYALGTLLYESLAGSNPCLNGIETPTFHEICWTQIGHVPPLLTEVVPAIPDYVARVTQRAIAKAPENRYGSMHEFGIALREAERRFTLECKQRRLTPTLRDLVSETDAILGPRKRVAVGSEKHSSTGGVAVALDPARALAVPHIPTDTTPDNSTAMLAVADPNSTDPTPLRSPPPAHADPNQASEKTPEMSVEAQAAAARRPSAGPGAEQKALAARETVRMFPAAVAPVIPIGTKSVASADRPRETGGAPSVVEAPKVEHVAVPPPREPHVRGRSSPAAAIVPEPTPSPVATPARVSQSKRDVERKPAPGTPRTRPAGGSWSRRVASLLSSPGRVAAAAAVCGLVIAVPIGLAVGLSRRGPAPEAVPATEVTQGAPVSGSDPVATVADPDAGAAAQSAVPDQAGTAAPAPPASSAARSAPATPPSRGSTAKVESDAPIFGPPPTPAAKPQPAKPAAPKPARSESGKPDDAPLPPLPGSGL